MALELASDLRLAFRTLRTRPGLSAVIIATLAVGIGASTATFSLLSAALLRPLPFEKPSELVMLWGTFGPERSIRGASVPELADWRAWNRSLTDVSVFDPFSVNLRLGDDAPARINAERVNPGYFRLLGTSAALGRTFTPDEDAVADAFPVAVISHSLWASRFGADSALIGNGITLNDRSFTVIGIMPEGFSGLSFQADIWIPLVMLTVDQPVSTLTSRGNRWLAGLGRLKPGVTREAASRDLEAVAARLAAQYPETNTNRSVLLQSPTENFLGTTASLFQAIFQAVLLVLLIACANVMSLQLVRATAREREIALRLALGAGKGDLIRQLLSEGLVLAGISGALGILLAWWTMQLLVPLAPTGLFPAYLQISLDWRVLTFGLGITLACGIVCGLAPVLRGGRNDLAGALREGARAASSGLGRLRRPGVQQFLVAGEVALALMLLAGAGTMMRSLRERLSVSPGFDTEGTVAARVTLPRNRYPVAGRAAFADRLVERLQAVPGVEAATVATDLPLRANTSAGTMLTDAPGAEPFRYYRHSATPGFFRALGIPLLRGRHFDTGDHAEAPLVAAISDVMARRLWPGQEALGRRLRLGNATGPEVTVVAVVGNARFRDLTTDLAAPTSEPDVYFPFAQRTDSDLDIAVRFRTGTPLAPEILQRAIAAIDPALPVFAVQPFSVALAAQNAAPRFGSLMLGVYSGVALLLAAIGIYGVVAFVVGLCRREIAIRLALGAHRVTVVRVVMGNALTLVVSGAGLGLLGAGLTAGVLKSQVYGVEVLDPATLALVTGTVLMVAIVACWIPARRAAGVDPQSVLKGE